MPEPVHHRTKMPSPVHVCQNKVVKSWVDSSGGNRGRSRILKKKGGAPMSAKGASFLGGPGVMPPRNFLKFESLKWPFPAL